MGKLITGLNEPNNTGNFYPADDHWRIERYPFKWWLALEQGTLIWPEISWNNVTGLLSRLTGDENENGGDFMGILCETISTTDENFAEDGKMISIREPVSKYAKAYFKTWSGTLSSADLFKTVKIHTDKKSLAVDTIGNGARILAVSSSTEWVCRFEMPSTVVA